MTTGIGDNTGYLPRNILGEIAVGKVLQFANIFRRVIDDVHFADLNEGAFVRATLHWRLTLSIQSFPTMMLLTRVVTFLHEK